MTATADISPALVADLFEAASAEHGLGRFVSLIASHAGVGAGALVLTRDGRYLEVFSSDVIREQTHLYQAYYHRLDPWRPRGGVPGSDRIVLANELFPESELVKTEFYRDFAQPMGMFRPMSAYLSLAGGEMVALGVEQPFATRLLEEADKNRLERLVPYIKRALELRLKLKLAQFRGEVGLGALNALALGVVVADSLGRVLFANDAADAMARAGHGLTLHGGRISAIQQTEARQLRDALVRVAEGQLPEGGIRLSDERRDPVAIALVSPMPAVTEPASSLPSVMVTARPLRDPAPPSPSLLKSVFGLSPTQAAIALDLLGGLSVDDIASARDIKPVTVRWHLSEIFRRCGVENQRGLVRALSAIPDLHP